MNNSEWRSKLDLARTHIAAIIQDEFTAMAETYVLHALRRLEDDLVPSYRELLEGLNSAHATLLADPQAKPGPSSPTGFDILAAEARGEKWEDLGLEKARSERDVARASMAGVNFEFLIRAWLEWRLKAPQTPSNLAK